MLPSARIHLGFALICLLMLLPARARAEGTGGFLFDLASGVSIPIGDSAYKRFDDPSFKVSVRAGYAIPVANFYLAPELTFDTVPVNTNDSNFQNNGIDASFIRLRILAGPRFIAPFGPGAFFLRIGFGIDYLSGTYKIHLGPTTVSTDASSTGFTFEPGLGIQFKVVGPMVLGMSVDFPIALHDFGHNSGSFTAADCDLLGFVGIRL